MSVDNCSLNEKNVNFDAAWLSEREEYFQGLYNDIMKLRDQGKFAGRKIAVVGCWNNFMEVKKIIEQLSLKVSFIADNNPKKQGISRCGIVSQSVESLVDEENIAILVINNMYWKDLRQQLISLQFVENKDFFVLYGGAKFEADAKGTNDTSIIFPRTWDELRLQAWDGFQSYKKINDKYKGLPIWLMHQPSLGDLYIFSLFLPIAMGKKTVSECDCVLIVTKNSTKKLAEAIGYRNIELITFEEANKNWLVLLKLMGDQLNIRNAVYHGLNTIFQSLVWNTAVTFRDSFTKYVFHFEQEVEPIFFDFPKRRDVVFRQFTELGLQPGKTVLISPYAGHFEASISENQWKYLVNKLIEKGYSVCTNCGSANELPLPNTIAASIELQDCVEFVEMAGYFIGIRSGFCDLICKADCKKIVIYETGATAASIDYFGFANMRIADDIIELINDCIHTDQLMDEILQYF